mmetsp:Transcript_12275/g.33705  ORF Transcript_12275/g.33705 Transcript_12275/m.33705 type:complete len:203 (-) Transcript_12275:343-951(-)
MELAQASGRLLKRHLGAGGTQEAVTILVRLREGSLDIVQQRRVCLEFFPQPVVQTPCRNVAGRHALQHHVVNPLRLSHNLGVGDVHAKVELCKSPSDDLFQEFLHRGIEWARVYNERALHQVQKLMLVDVTRLVGIVPLELTSEARQAIHRLLDLRLDHRFAPCLRHLTWRCQCMAQELRSRRHLASSTRCASSLRCGRLQR